MLPVQLVSRLCLAELLLQEFGASHSLFIFRHLKPVNFRVDPWGHLEALFLVPFHEDKFSALHLERSLLVQGSACPCSCRELTIVVNGLALFSRSLFTRLAYYDHSGLLHALPSNHLLVRDGSLLNNREVLLTGLLLLLRLHLLF